MKILCLFVNASFASISLGTTVIGKEARSTVKVLTSTLAGEDMTGRYGNNIVTEKAAGIISEFISNKLHKYSQFADDKRHGRGKYTCE